MADINPEELWFNEPDVWTLCRMGGNGPKHPSQLYAIKKYVKPDMTLLDYGCGSATTFEAMQIANIKIKSYLGLDIIPKNVVWCKENFPEGNFEVNKSIHKIDKPDKSFDVVYSRHVVDHMESFEDAMDEHCRVSKDLVIAIFWVPLGDIDEHEISNIVAGPEEARVTYTNEYTNRYSRKKVMEWIENKKDWKLLELTEGIKNENQTQGAASNHDWVLVLRRRDE